MSLFARKLHDSIVAKLSRYNFKSETETYVYLMAYVAVFFCLLVHMFLLISFWAFGDRLLTGMNILSLLIYLLLLYLLKNRNLFLVGTLVSTEVTLYATTVGILCGLSTHIVGYYVLVIIMQVMFPFGKKKSRHIILGAQIASVAAVIACNYNVAEPAHPLSSSLETYLTVSNIAILIIGTLAQLYVSQYMQSMVSDINERRVEELSGQVNTDPLTGLYNRRYATEFFEQLSASAEKETYCIAIIDIDDFKKVNDTWGHNCGDEVLLHLSELLRTNLRKTDTVFRWGGEEFLVVLEGINLNSAYTVLNKMREKLQKTPAQTKQGAMSITVTIGVSVLDAGNITDSIENSDQKLYTGKSCGKNCVII